MEDSISDHFPIFNLTDVKLGLKNAKVTHAVTRIITQDRADDFICYLEEEFAQFEQQSDVDTAAAHFMEAITNNMDRFFPKKRYQRKTTPKNPWMTSGILISINVKNELYKKYLRERTVESLRRYKHYRNVLIDAIRKAKQLYYKKY